MLNILFHELCNEVELVNGEFQNLSSYVMNSKNETAMMSMWRSVKALDAQGVEAQADLAVT